LFFSLFTSLSPLPTPSPPKQLITIDAVLLYSSFGYNSYRYKEILANLKQAKDLSVIFKGEFKMEVKLIFGH
jgi:hypothetical protein